MFLNCAMLLQGLGDEIPSVPVVHVVPELPPQFQVAAEDMECLFSPPQSISKDTQSRGMSYVHSLRDLCNVVGIANCFSTMVSRHLHTTAPIRSITTRYGLERPATHQLARVLHIVRTVLHRNDPLAHDEIVQGLTKYCLRQSTPSGFLASPACAP